MMGPGLLPLGQPLCEPLQLYKLLRPQQPLQWAAAMVGPGLLSLCQPPPREPLQW